MQVGSWHLKSGALLLCTYVRIRVFVCARAKSEILYFTDKVTKTQRNAIKEIRIEWFSRAGYVLVHLPTSNYTRRFTIHSTYIRHTFTYCKYCTVSCTKKGVGVRELETECKFPHKLTRSKYFTCESLSSALTISFPTKNETNRSSWYAFFARITAWRERLHAVFGDFESSGFANQISNQQADTVHRHIAVF